MTIMELKHQLDLLLAEAGADLEVEIPGMEQYQIVLLPGRVQLRAAYPECFYCGREMSAEECGDELPSERICDNCASKMEI